MKLVGRRSYNRAFRALRYEDYGEFTYIGLVVEIFEYIEMENRAMKSLFEVFKRPANTSGPQSCSFVTKPATQASEETTIRKTTRHQQSHLRNIGLLNLLGNLLLFEQPSQIVSLLRSNLI